MIFNIKQRDYLKTERLFFKMSTNIMNIFWISNCCCIPVEYEQFGGNKRLGFGVYYIMKLIKVIDNSQDITGLVCLNLSIFQFFFVRI